MAGQKAGSKKGRLTCASFSSLIGIPIVLVIMIAPSREYLAKSCDESRVLNRCLGRDGSSSRTDLQKFGASEFEVPSLAKPHCQIVDIDFLLTHHMTFC
jgi:hypothetical protein